METKEVTTFYGKMTFDGEHCFLCGEPLNSDNATVEHVFPKWLQRRNNLWDQTLRLLNGTTIKYRQLTVPCCKSCNGIFLSKIEKDMRDAMEKGTEFIRGINKIVIYKWVIKILYCTLYKQLSLKANIKDDTTETIVTHDFLAQYKLIFDFMQSIRKDISIEETCSSVFIFDVLLSNNINKDFFYVDDILHAQVAMETNGIGIICTIGDAGAINNKLNSYFYPFYQMRLSKVQHGQLIADVFYNRAILKDNVNIVFLPNGIVQLTPFESEYKEFKQKEYALVLYYILQRFGFQLQDLYSEKYDATMNFLIDGDRRIISYNSEVTYCKGEIHTGYLGDIFEEKQVKGYLQ